MLELNNIKVKKIAIVSHWIPTCAQGEAVDIDRIYGGLETYVLSSIKRLKSADISWFGCNPNQLHEVRKLSHNFSDAVNVKFISIKPESSDFTNHEIYWRNNIWLPMHGLGKNRESKTTLTALWSSFLKIQERLCEAICKHGFYDYDHLFVLDMQSCLIADLLKRDFKGSCKSSSTFFISTSFPSEEDFFSMPNANKIIKSLVAYSNICVQTESAKRAFASTVRQYQLKSPNCLKVPCFIPSKDFLEKRRLRSKLIQKDKINVVWAGRVDPTKSPIQALQAMEIVLTKKGLKKPINFIFIGQPAGYLEGIYGECQEAVAQLSRRLLRGFPECFTYKEGLERVKLLEILSKSQGCIINSIADGFNLIALEFLYSKSRYLSSFQADSSPLCGLFLSKHAGIYEFLGEGANSPLILRNPENPEELAQKIRIFIEMSSEQCRSILDQQITSLQSKDTPSLFNHV